MARGPIVRWSVTVSGRNNRAMYDDSSRGEGETPAEAMEELLKTLDSREESLKEHLVTVGELIAAVEESVE